MSTERQQWQYRVTAIDDDLKEVNALMGKWAEAGWELVSGTAASWASKDIDSPTTIWHVQHIMYWRKPLP